MLYYIFEYLTDFYSGFDVFRYLTLRIILSALTALLVSLIIGPIVIKYFSSREVFQSIRDDGPQSHLKTKSQTPSMGGLIIIVSILISTLLWADINNKNIWILIFVLITFGLIGFYDDYKKFKHSTSDGIKGKTKLLLQILFAGVVVFYIFQTSDHTIDLSLTIPFIKDYALFMGAFFIPWSIFVIVGSSNAVNLTDGLDGLAILPCILIAAAFVVFSYVQGNFNIANYLLIPYLPHVSETAIFASAIVGSGLGFLWYNSYPAQIFMGDVGSLSLGAILATLAIILRLEIIYAIMGGIFVIEALSVIIQVTSFKLFKKRVFKMSPIHHHFELNGWQEPKIIVRFWIITFVLVLIALASLKIR